MRSTSQLEDHAMTRTPSPCLSLIAVVLLSCTDQPPPEMPPPAPAATPLAVALASIGTPAALAGLQGLALEGAGTTAAWDEGTDPSEALVPSPSSEFTVAASLDLAGDRMRLAYRRKYLLVRPGTAATFTETIAGPSGWVSGDDRVTGDGGAAYLARLSAARVASTRRQQVLANPHLLLRRLTDAAVTDGGTVDLAGHRHRRLVVKDPDKGADLELLVDVASGRLSALSTTESDPLRGDVAVRASYEQWEATGALYLPRRVSIAVDGLPVWVESRTSFFVNPAFPGDLFTFPGPDPPVVDPADALRGGKNGQSTQRFVAMGVGSSNEFPHDTVKAVELAPGVHHLIGSTHHSLVIDQGETVVVVDAPDDAARARSILAWIDRSLAGKRVSHVVITHHHVDRSAGARTFVAQGAALVVGEESQALWTRVLAAPRTVDPDDLTRKPVTPQGTAVKRGTPLGLGNVSVHHLVSQHAADMLLVRVATTPPVVFVSDLYVPSATGILPRSSYVVWGKELDDGLGALKVEDATVLVSGEGNVDAAGNPFKVTVAMFRAQLAAAMAAP
jgi:glyoxylase-like metal-dependent hydrolase (beta-lactamase superfamily II)